MAMTLTDDAIFAGDGTAPLRHLGAIDRIPTKDLLSWTQSMNPIERSFGLATLNSLLPLENMTFHEGNALELTATLGAGKRVVVVGHFPHMNDIAARAAHFAVLEKRPQPGDLPAEAAPEVIPQADVVTMTGVTCLNDTIEGLLALKKPGATFIMLGPSVPLSPLLFDAGIDIIGGMWVENADEVWRCASQGATPRLLRGVRHVLGVRRPELVPGLPSITPPPEQPAWGWNPRS
jgi:uncharacterized protein